MKHKLCGRTFEQSVAAHSKGAGCKYCASKPSNEVIENHKNEFIKLSTDAHNNKYTYLNVEYVNNSKKVSILCHNHGYFYQSPRDHLHALAGCPSCSKNKKYDRSEFITKINARYKGRLKVISGGESRRSPLVVECLCHKMRTKTTAERLLKCGDKLPCASRTRVKTLDYYIDIIEKNKSCFFSFEKFSFTSVQKKSTVICKLCGYVDQRNIRSLIKHPRCSQCGTGKHIGWSSLASEVIDYNRECTFYSATFTNIKTRKSFKKIGITTRPVKERFCGYHKHFEIAISYTLKANLLSCLLAESCIKDLKINDSFRIHDFKELGLKGWTECYPLTSKLHSVSN